MTKSEKIKFYTNLILEMENEKKELEEKIETINNRLEELMED